jgi:hypothetical protein
MVMAFMSMMDQLTGGAFGQLMNMLNQGPLEGARNQCGGPNQGGPPQPSGGFLCDGPKTPGLSTRPRTQQEVAKEQTRQAALNEAIRQHEASGSLPVFGKGASYGGPIGHSISKFLG